MVIVSRRARRKWRLEFKPEPGADFMEAVPEIEITRALSARHVRRADLEFRPAPVAAELGGGIDQ